MLAGSTRIRSPQAALLRTVWRFIVASTSFGRLGEGVETIAVVITVRGISAGPSKTAGGISCCPYPDTASQRTRIANTFFIYSPRPERKVATRMLPAATVPNRMVVVGAE